MSTSELQAFHHELLQEIHLYADADGRFAEDAFFDVFCRHLLDAGELETADRARYEGARGVRIDGYGGEPSASDGVLSVIIADFNQGAEVETLTATDMAAIFKRGRTFVAKSLEREFRNQLEETSAGFGLADTIAGCWNVVSRVRLFLISNRVMSTRVDSLPEGDIEGKPVLLNVWDLGRLHRYASSGKSREDIVVDLAEYGGQLPVLPAHLSNAGYEAYLTVMPGEQLASIYARWGARLLEQNVRVFLQAKGGVNKGIRNTLDRDPGMFFAYNNGITATAEAVTTKTVAHGQVITNLKNLQIVNGGQTTASIAAAQRNAVDLSKVFVQMKLSVIPPTRAEEVVPKISEYANSQNRVNAADFFANHPFHLRMKEFSERTLAPSRDGSIRESKWFYERARGQYQDAKVNLTASARKKFDLEYPKDQVFAKTDLAKFLTVWEGQPHIVSRGAQKNFGYFAEEIGKRWSEKQEVYNEAFYREAIAKAIVFRGTEALVTNQPWYEGGYRAQVVAYAISKLGYDLERFGRRIDFESVWKAQAMPAGLRDALTVASEVVKDVLVNPPPGRHKNVTEWAKQTACWNRVQEASVDWPDSLSSVLIGAQESRARARDAVKEQKMLSGIEAQTAVVEAGAQAWRHIRDWAVAKKLLSQKELEIMSVALALPNKIPSEKQSLSMLQSLAKLREEGCPHGQDIRTVH